jgi:uncharacterized protein YcbK (DUF882 family)
VPVVWELCTPKEQAKYLADAKKPIRGNTRGAKEVDAYNASQAKNRKLWQDRRQWERYKVTLGEKAPKTFTSFRRMKYNNSTRFDDLVKEYKATKQKTGKRMF